MRKEFVVTNNIRELRFFTKMTQQQLAKAAGVSRQTIISIEGGKYKPSLELAFQIAKVFDKEIGEVFQYVRIEKK